MERQNALALQSCEGSQTFLLRENSPLRQRNRPSTHRSIPPIIPEHGRLGRKGLVPFKRFATGGFTAFEPAKPFMACPLCPSMDASQTFLLRENWPLRQRNRPSTHRSIPPIFPEHGRLAAAAFETSEKGATADTIVSGGRKANAEARANALQRGLMRIMGRSDGKTRSRNGGGHRATKTPDAEAPGVLEWGVWRCSTFTGNTTDYHRR